MKTRLLALATTAAIGLGSNVAAAGNYDVSGFVSVNMGVTFTDFDSSSSYGESGSAFVFGGQGRVNVWLDPGMSLQLDAEGEGTTSIDQYSGSSDGRTSGIFGAHLSWRDPKNHLLGFFAALQSASNIDYDGNMAHLIAGVEGQIYCGQWTFYGQAGFMPLFSDSDYYEPENVWFGRAVARYFLNPNDRLQGEIGFASGDVNGASGDVDHLIWGASWEHRWQGTPFSAGIMYNGFYSDGLYSDWAQEHIVQATFTIHFGDDSLEDQDHNGATLDMPNFARAFGWSYWLGY